MDYPLFEVPRMGGGVFIGIVAIIHVVIAQLAVGAGLFIAIAHTLAVRNNDRLLLDFLARFGRFLVLLAFVSGAITGVGIWVTISLVSPPSTSMLIHLFVWGWAIEWVFFLIEIVAGYMYYYGWHRLTPRRHIAVAWIYAFGAFMSLAVINGIICFMLTPGDWVPPWQDSAYDGQQAFWIGFFNPTYWPSLVLRTILSMALAAISVAMVVNCIRSYSREQKTRIINAGSYLLMPIGLVAPAAAWFFFAVPENSRNFAFGGAIAMTLFFAFGAVLSLFIAGYAYWALIHERSYANLQTSVLLLALAFVAVGSLEFMREGIRKPYLVHGHMYSNGILATDEWRERINRDGLLTYARFAYPPTTTLEEVHRLPPHEMGRFVFNAQCRICHEPEGTNDPAPLVNQSSRELLTKVTSELHELKHFMPPFVGTEHEKRALVEYQLFLARGEAYAPPPGATSSAATPPTSRRGVRDEGDAR